MKDTIFYDSNYVRFRLAKKSGSNVSYDWLFLSGGPGADSCYFLDLIDQISAPGNFWLLDFPANGNNLPSNISPQYDFDLWESYLIPALQKFKNPILVGHSFGAMLPLLFPELEKILLGFVLLNAAPKLWFEEAAQYAKEHNIIANVVEGKKFRENPSPKTFKAALLANAYCHFPQTSLEKGKLLFQNLPFNYHAVLWWLQKAQSIQFNAKWIPQKIPTLIINGARDFVVPPTVFEKDTRFCRQNIQSKIFPGAGHFVWIDQMEAVVKEFHSFHQKLRQSQYK